MKTKSTEINVDQIDSEENNTNNTSNNNIKLNNNKRQREEYEEEDICMYYDPDAEKMLSSINYSSSSCCTEEEEEVEDEEVTKAKRRLLEIYNIRVEERMEMVRALKKIDVAITMAEDEDCGRHKDYKYSEIKSKLRVFQKYTNKTEIEVFKNK